MRLIVCAVMLFGMGLSGSGARELFRAADLTSRGFIAGVQQMMTIGAGAILTGICVLFLFLAFAALLDSKFPKFDNIFED